MPPSVPVPPVSRMDAVMSLSSSSRTGGRATAPGGPVDPRSRSGLAGSTFLTPRDERNVTRERTRLADRALRGAPDPSAGRGLPDARVGQRGRRRTPGDLVAGQPDRQRPAVENLGAHTWSASSPRTTVPPTRRRFLAKLESRPNLLRFSLKELKTGGRKLSSELNADGSPVISAEGRRLLEDLVPRLQPGHPDLPELHRAGALVPRRRTRPRSETLGTHRISPPNDPSTVWAAAMGRGVHGPVSAVDIDRRKLRCRRDCFWTRWRSGHPHLRFTRTPTRQPKPTTTPATPKACPRRPAVSTSPPPRASMRVIVISPTCWTSRAWS